MTRHLKISFYLVLCLALLLGSASLLLSCSNDSAPADSNKTQISPLGENSLYSGLDLGDYVTLCDYVNLELRKTDGTKTDMESAVKEHIFGNSEIKKYPEDAVKYYFEQEKAFYMHLAENDIKQYEALLAEAGITESDFETLAKKYVAEDMIFYAITKDADITLTDDEKSSLLDKYADEYVKLYGYSEDYIKQNMTELIYDSMLYDKTMEYLIENNNFTK